MKAIRGANETCKLSMSMFVTNNIRSLTFCCSIRTRWGSSRLHRRLRRLSKLSAADKDENDDAKPLDEVKDKIDAAVEAIKQRFDTIVGVIPQPILDFLQLVVDKLNSWKLLFAGFLAGAVFCLAAIVVPIYSEVETLSQPVTLFETILGDLSAGYVDEVDTERLFETGVKAMLGSLDPYTEFETKSAAADLTESIDGRYAGIGLVIAGSTTPVPQDSPVEAQPVSLETQDGSKLLPKQALEDAKSTSAVEEDDDDDEDTMSYAEEQRQLAKARQQGIRVVSAFEGYAFDYGLRPGDKLLAVDHQPLAGLSVEQVRNRLRGEPGTAVVIDFERDGVEGVQSVVIPRSVVRVRDVKLATLLGKPSDGIGYIQLTGFSSDTGREMRSAIHFLQATAEDASEGERTLQGLILDLRGNPGGLLTSAVDVASLLVPKGSDIVSAKGRGFPGILYRSRADPILDSSTKLAVLINGGTASAAEIVSGAVQDLDAGIIVGSDRSFGKGLVQNVEDLPFNTALKFTVAKYYTPSGRCIQGINYSEGDNDKYIAKKVADKDRSVFYTKGGRVVKDGGGVEADYKVPAPQASALEVTLLRAGVFSEFAAEWSKKNELTNNFEVDEDTYKSFQAFVGDKQRSGELQLEGLYDRSLQDLKKALKKSGYKGSEKVVEQLQASIVREVQKDFEKYRADIKEDISQNILARYLPESMLIERGLRNDKQVDATVKLLTSNKFERLLAAGRVERDARGPVNLATATDEDGAEDGRIRASVSF